LKEHTGVGNFSMSFLERLKQKPQHVKGQYAFGIAFFLTMLIAVMWSVSLPARFAGMNEAIVPDEIENGSFLDGVIQEAESQLGNVIDTTTEETESEGFRGIPTQSALENFMAPTPTPTEPAPSEAKVPEVSKPEVVTPIPAETTPVVEESPKPIEVPSPSNIILQPSGTPTTPTEP
jgi:hypothetical protein